MEQNKTGRMRRQNGFTLVEMMIALAIAGTVAASALAVSASIDIDRYAQSEQVASANLISTVATFWGYGNLSTVTSSNLAASGMLPVGWRLDGIHSRDSGGNQVFLDGWGNNLAIKFGGPLPGKVCSALAQAAAQDNRIRKVTLGTVTMPGGAQISGTYDYKNAGVVDATKLIPGCSKSGGSMVGLQYSNG